MIATNDKIIVRINPHQKDKALIGNTEIDTMKRYNPNFRDRNPVLCEVVNGNDKIKNGTLLLVHHNRFAEYSPHYLGDNQYSLPYDRSIFCRVDSNGEAHSLCQNILVERLYPKSAINVASAFVKPYMDRVVVKNNGYGFKKGQILLTWHMSDYEVIYNWKGIEKRVVKVFKEDIVGVLKIRGNRWSYDNDEVSMFDASFILPTPDDKFVDLSPTNMDARVQVLIDSMVNGIKIIK